MSKHPDNPWWSQTSDQPMMPHDQASWDDAHAHGFLTADHVLLRLEAILRVAVGEPVDDGASYNEDGFVIALVAAGWSGEGWRVQLHPNDHDPPHVHFSDTGDRRRQIRLSLVSGEPLDGERIPPGVRKKLERASSFIMENQAMLIDRWQQAHE